MWCSTVNYNVCRLRLWRESTKCGEAQWIIMFICLSCLINTQRIVWTIVNYNVWLVLCIRVAYHIALTSGFFLCNQNVQPMPTRHGANVYDTSPTLNHIGQTTRDYWDIATKRESDVKQIHLFTHTRYLQLWYQEHDYTTYSSVILSEYKKTKLNKPEFKVNSRSQLASVYCNSHVLNCIG